MDLITETRQAGEPSRRIIRNVRIGRRRTSIALERALWDALEEICRCEGRTPSDVCTDLVAAGPGRGLTPAVRVFIVERLRRHSSESQGGNPVIARPQAAHEAATGGPGG